MNFIKRCFSFVFSKKFLTFTLVFFMLTGFSLSWEPFFMLFDGYNDDFRVFWWFSLIITAVWLYATTASWKLAFGRSLLFVSGIGACGSIIMMMTGGPQTAIAPVVFTALAFGGSYPLINHVVLPDPHALDNLAAFSKHLRGFPDFYRNELQEWMHAQEERRDKAVRHQWIGLCFAVPGAAFITGLIDYYLLPDPSYNSDGDWHYFFLMIIWGLSLAFTAGPACVGAWELKDDMKEKLLEKLTGYFDEFKHHKKLDFNPDKFRDAGLIRRYNRQDVDDGFTGKHGHVSFALTEIDLRHVTGSGKNRRTEYIFDGLMIVMSFPLPFKGRTLVLKDHGKIGNWLKDKSTNLERINLGIKQFEDVFEVYSTDQIEARAILTPDLMENLIKLGAMFDGMRTDRFNEKDDLAAAKGKIELAFLDSVLMITVATGKNLFEVGHLDASMEDTTRIAQFAREVGLIYEIIDMLELNRKAETLAAVKVSPQGA